MTKIELLTRKQYAEKHNTSEIAVAYAVKVGNLSKVEFEWESRDGKKYQGKFILPAEYAIVNRDKMLQIAKGL